MMTPIAAVGIDPARARVYAEGWQSWSQTGSFPIGRLLARLPPHPALRHRQRTVRCLFAGSGAGEVFDVVGVAGGV
jgi:hypothetical protein